MKEGCTKQKDRQTMNYSMCKLNKQKQYIILISHKVSSVKSLGTKNGS